MVMTKLVKFETSEITWYCQQLNGAHFDPAFNALVYGESLPPARTVRTSLISSCWSIPMYDTV